jgi:hypothetical protein
MTLLSSGEMTEHPPVGDPSCDPRDQGVVLNSIEERVQIKVDAPRRAIHDEAARPLDRLMGRAPRPVAEAVGMEVRIEDGGEHLR